LSYAASLVPEVGDTATAIDDAMKMGYNWIKGPFELIDEIGVDYLTARLEADKKYVPEFLRSAAGSSFYNAEAGLKARSFSGDWVDIDRPDGTLRFNDKRKTLNPIFSNDQASCYDVDGVALVEFHSKANALGAGSMQILEQALERRA